jgi:hypothetical protein
MFLDLEEYILALERGYLIYYLGDARLGCAGEYRDRESKVFIDGPKGYEWESLGGGVLERIGIANCLGNGFQHFWDGENMRDLHRVVSEWKEGHLKLSSDYSLHSSRITDENARKLYELGVEHRRTVDEYKRQIEGYRAEMERGGNEEEFLGRITECQEKITLECEKNVRDKELIKGEFLAELDAYKLAIKVDFDKFDAEYRLRLSRFVPWEFRADYLMSWGSKDMSLEGLKLKVRDYIAVADECWKRCLGLLFVKREVPKKKFTWDGRLEETTKVVYESLPCPLGRGAADGIILGLSGMKSGLVKMRRDIEEKFRGGCDWIVEGCKEFVKRGGRELKLLMEAPYLNPQSCTCGYRDEMYFLFSCAETLRYQLCQMLCGLEDGIVSLNHLYALNGSVANYISYLEFYCDFCVGALRTECEVYRRYTKDREFYEPLGVDLRNM